GCTQRVFLIQKICCQRFCSRMALPTALHSGRQIVFQNSKLVKPRSGRESRKRCGFSDCATPFTFHCCRHPFGDGTTSAIPSLIQNRLAAIFGNGSQEG